MERITLATFKKFLRDNEENLYIKNKTSFDGMTDCVTPCDNNGFRKIVKNNNSGKCNINKNTLGYDDNIWLVESSRDYFKPYQDESYEGISVYNCCGSFIVAKQRGGD